VKFLLLAISIKKLFKITVFVVQRMCELIEDLDLRAEMDAFLPIRKPVNGLSARFESTKAFLPDCRATYAKLPHHPEMIGRE
jgi:hypothetical protein